MKKTNKKHKTDKIQKKTTYSNNFSLVIIIQKLKTQKKNKKKIKTQNQTKTNLSYIDCISAVLRK